MNNIISKKFYLELSFNENKPYNNKELFCKVNDSIKLYIKLKEDGVIRNLENCKISMISHKRGNCHLGTVIEQDIQKVVVDKGYIVITPKREFTSTISTVVSEITIYDEDEAITTQSFIFQVFKALNDNVIEAEKNSIDTLIDLKRMLSVFEMNVDEIRTKIEILKEQIEELDDKLNGGGSSPGLDHEHDNLEVLDSITQEDIEAWDNAVNLLNNSNEEIQSGLGAIDSINDIYDKVKSAVYFELT